MPLKLFATYSAPFNTIENVAACLDCFAVEYLVGEKTALSDKEWAKEPEYKIFNIYVHTRCSDLNKMTELLSCICRKRKGHVKEVEGEPQKLIDWIKERSKRTLTNI